MLRKKYVDGRYCHPIFSDNYTYILLRYILYILIQVLGKLITKWVKDTWQIRNI